VKRLLTILLLLLPATLPGAEPPGNKYEQSLL